MGGKKKKDGNLKRRKHKDEKSFGICQQTPSDGMSVMQVSGVIYLSWVCQVDLGDVLTVRCKLTVVHDQGECSLWWTKLAARRELWCSGTTTPLTPPGKDCFCSLHAFVNCELPQVGDTHSGYWMERILLRTQFRCCCFSGRRSSRGADPLLAWWEGFIVSLNTKTMPRKHGCSNLFSYERKKNKAVYRIVCIVNCWCFCMF